MLPHAYVVRREGNVLTRVCPSVCPRGGGGTHYPYPIMLCNITQNAMGQTRGGGTWPGPARGVPISHNALQHDPEFYGADTLWGGGGAQPGPAGVGWGGYPARSGWGGTLPGGYPRQCTPPARVPPGRVPPPGQVRMGGGCYPVRTTEGVLTTRRAVCLLRSRRRTFLYSIEVTIFTVSSSWFNLQYMYLLQNKSSNA